MKKHLLSFTLFCCLLSHANRGYTIEPFTTDGCSMFPNGTISHNSLWLDCCISHDFAYWQGGTYQQRLAADNRLRDCVAGTGASFTAEIMLEGVRIGGSPFFPTTYRWGYGWPWLRGYKQLSPSELKQIQRAQRDSGKHPLKK
jgi:hypothetical protein